MQSTTTREQVTHRQHDLHQSAITQIAYLRKYICDQHQRYSMAVAKLSRSNKSFRELIMELGSIDKCSCELCSERRLL